MIKQKKSYSKDNQKIVKIKTYKMEKTKLEKMLKEKFGDKLISVNYKRSPKKYLREKAPKSPVVYNMV